MGKRYSRREFLEVSASAATGILAASLIGCSGGGSSSATSPVAATSEVTTFRAQRGITAVYRPSDLALYRQLLPASFDLPTTPELTIAIVHYYSVTSPLIPYHEAYVMLSCTYQGQAALYTVTTPVDDQTAYDIGHDLGYPRYLADSIELTSGAACTGQVSHQGRTVLRMSLVSLAAATTYSRSNASPPCVNLVPPGVGPQILTVNIVGQQSVTVQEGNLSIEVDPGENWGALLNGAQLITAQYLQITGSYRLVSAQEPATDVVSIARVKNGRVDLAVQEAIGLLGGIAAVTNGKQRIMLKPNLVSEDPKATTNPQVVAALAQLMMQAGKDVSIGEGSAMATGYNYVNGVMYRTKSATRLNGLQSYVFNTLGYTALAGSLGVPLVNLHTGEMATVPVPGGFVYQEVSLHRSLTEIDLLCSVPMMKTHILSGVTLGMKNMMGTYPGSVYGALRSLVHDKAAAVESSGVSGAVVDMVRANKLGLVVIDATTAMEGNGPSNGPLLRMDLIIAGTNPVATDMVAANVMGFEPVEVPTFKWAHLAGLGPQRLTQIEVRGESIAAVRRPFQRPQISPWNSVRSSFGSQEIT